MSQSFYTTGIDAGSTTVKVAVIDGEGKLLFKGYRRHNSRIRETLASLLSEASGSLAGDHEVSLNMTGSAGMGLAENMKMPFIQEVVASALYVEKFYPGTSVLMDLGGEDSKMIFFSPFRGPDIRMNGNCAGGTGSFIDQMASLLNMSVREMDELAGKSSTVYPIASRCGVFAKTDVQNLISRRIPVEDIAASVFHAVALQAITTLSRGKKPVSPFLLVGGPVTFIKSLPPVFASVLNEDPANMEVPPDSEFVPAIGAAYGAAGKNRVKLSDITERLKKPFAPSASKSGGLKPLFKDSTLIPEWKKENSTLPFKRYDFNRSSHTDAFLGIDSGSSTTKITVITGNDELLFDFYSNNRGRPLDTVSEGLESFWELMEEKGVDVNIRASAVTGYGEELIKAGLDLDFGIVETIAHYMAAKNLDENVSFVLDIGGQDMKAVFIENGSISKMEINEACSSGCGTFIEGFAESLGYSVSDFADMACYSASPSELGTRCTVFMNSRVKQAFRDGAGADDISAGLAYSVVQNCLFKVLNISNMDDLGDNVVAQGGAFRNPAILRALQQLTGKSVSCSTHPELMGAFGAALYAKQRSGGVGEKDRNARLKGRVSCESEKRVTCKGCTNHCVVTEFLFSNGNKYFSGNKCEKVFQNKGNEAKQGVNHYEYMYRTLFKKVNQPVSPKGLRIGIPRALNMYENFPFWNTLFNGCGISVELSAHSNYDMYKKGAGTVMSDNICMPAKMTHGHIIDLIEKGVDRIFFPITVYEKSEFREADNTFNCPVVTGYAEVLKSSLNPLKNYGIPLDHPVVGFRYRDLLKKSCRQYMKSLGVKDKTFKKAFENALRVSESVKHGLRYRGKQILENALSSGRLVIVLAGRPYHSDPFIQHKVAEMFTSMDVDVVSEDHFADSDMGTFSALSGVCQWAYPNRIISAASQVGRLPNNVQLVQLNSFGCGPDSFLMEKISHILSTKGKNHTVLKIDDITSPGSLRLRVRSLVESIRLNVEQINKSCASFPSNKTFTEDDRDRTILAPWFSDFYSPFIPSLAKVAGYRFENLPPSDRRSAELGLTYANNEICYPATLVVGDIIKGLQSGKYERNKVAVGITQTGGQCRATSYINLIKKALSHSGYSDVPVISVTGAYGAINEQPGFSINWKKMARITLSTLLYADALSSMYYSSVTREKEKGTSLGLVNQYIEAAKPLAENSDCRGLRELLEEAVSRFNNIPLGDFEPPRIGVVGEIYVKYNSFGNYNIVKWLIENGVEVVVPPLLDFMIQGFVNRKVNISKNLSRGLYFDPLTELMEWQANRMIRANEKIMQKYRFYRPLYPIWDEAEKASEILDLANQYGEGWLIPAEIAGFAREGVNHVVCMQPFGCIANHIIAKGVEKRIKDLYPSMDILYLDFDAGTTEVNVMNRLHFLMRSARAQNTCCDG